MGCGGHSKLPASAETIDSGAATPEQQSQPCDKETSPLPVALGSNLGDPNKSESNPAAESTTEAVLEAAPAAAETPKDPVAPLAATSAVAAVEPAKDVATTNGVAPAEITTEAIADAAVQPTADAANALASAITVESVDIQEDVPEYGACLNLPGRVSWIPEKKSADGPFCGSSIVNVPPEDRSILSRRHDGTLRLESVLLFVNPNGGRRKGVELGRRAVDTFETNSVCVTVIETQRAGHAEEYLRDASSDDLMKYQAVVGIGGDGTMSEMINGIMARKDGLRIPLGLLAGGTANSFIGDLQECENMSGYDNQKLLDTLEDTVRTWCAGAKLHGLDLGKLTFGDNSVRYSFNCVLMGLGVEANVLAEHMRILGPARYDLGALGAIAMNRQRTYTITIDGATVEYPASIVGIYGTQSASFRMSPGAKVDDGLLDFSGLGPMPRGKLLHVFDEMKRDGCHVFEGEVSHHRGKRIEIISGDGPELVNVDGENCGCAPLICEVQPAAVQFLVAGAQK